MECGRLAGKVAVVTGGASGIGKGIVTRFVDEGASVGILDASGAEADFAAELGDSGIGLHADVSDSTSMREAFEVVVAHFGRLDILCNNAGIGLDRATPVAECAEAMFDRVLAVNLRGVFLGMKYAIPALTEAGASSIINISSAAGLVPLPGEGAYCASKAAVIHLTRVAALEYAGAGIRVNAICPGVIHTPLMQPILDLGPENVEAVINLHPLGRIGVPEDIAAMALYLASDDASFVTGGTFSVDGGFVLGSRPQPTH